MKMLLIALLASNAVACPIGYFEFHGNCTIDIPPEVAVQTFVPSDEKPPRDKMPSYQREGIKADMPVSMASQDAIMDQQKAEADSEGKKKAGIN